MSPRGGGGRYVVPLLMSLPNHILLLLRVSAVRVAVSRACLHLIVCTLLVSEGVHTGVKRSGALWRVEAPHALSLLRVATRVLLLLLLAVWLGAWLRRLILSTPLI